MGLASMLLVAGCGDDGGNTPVDGGVDAGDVGDVSVPMLVAHTPQEAISLHDVRLHVELMGGLGPYRILWSQSSGNPVRLIDPTTSNPSFSAPHVTADEALVFKVVAFDSLDQRVESSVTVNVVVTPLIASAGEDLRLLGGLPTSLHGSATGNLDQITYTWRQTAGMPTAAIERGNTANPVVNLPYVTAEETFTFEVKATNSEGAESTDTMDIIVSPNDVRAWAGNDLLATEGDIVIMNGAGIGGVGNLNYAWTVITEPSPGSIVLSQADTAAPSFSTLAVVPSAVPSVDVVLRLMVSDAHGHTDSDTVTISVHENPGGILTILPMPDLSLEEGQLGVLMTSVRGGTPPYAITWTRTAGPPAGLTPYPNQHAVFGAPAVDHVTLLIFEISVTDSSQGQSEPVKSLVHVIVTPKDVVVDVGADFTIEVGDGVHLSAKVTEGLPPYTYAWRQTGGSPVSLVGEHTPTPVFLVVSSPPDDEVLTFELTVEDSLNNTAMDTVDVTIHATPPLRVTAFGPTEAAGVPAGSTISLHATGSGGPRITPYGFLWEQTGGTAGRFSSAIRYTTEFETPHVTVDEELIFKVTVTRGVGFMVSETLRVQLRAPLLVDFTQSERTARSCDGLSACSTLSGGHTLCAGATPIPVLGYTVTGGQLTKMSASCGDAPMCNLTHDVQDPACASLDPSSPPAGATLDCLYCCAGENCNDPSALATPPAGTLLDCSYLPDGCCNMESPQRCMGGTATP